MLARPSISPHVPHAGTETGKRSAAATASPILTRTEPPRQRCADTTRLDTALTSAIEPTEIATALLLEARAFIAETSGALSWPRRAHAPSPNDALVSAWQAHPYQSVAVREGFAIARRALHSAQDSGAGQDASLKEIDAAIALLTT